MFAVVTICGKQFSVAKGDMVTVPKVPGNQGDTLVFDQVSMVSEKGRTSIGTPTVNGAKVHAKIVEQFRGGKIEVRRFKAKVRERKARGFRPHLTKLAIVSIG